MEIRHICACQILAWLQTFTEIQLLPSLLTPTLKTKTVAREAQTVGRERLNEDESCSFFRQIIVSLAFIHESGYAHHDLKPQMTHVLSCHI